MKIRLWQLLCFAGIIMGISYLIFPDDEILLHYAIEQGDLAKAQVLLKQHLAENPENPELLLLVAQLASVEGQPEATLANLEQLVGNNPGQIVFLRQLAQQYDWYGHADKALVTWEKVVELAPEDQQALRHIIEYNRSFRRTSQEVEAIARLLQLEAQSGQTAAAPIVEMFNQELNFTIGQRVVGDDLAELDAVISGLYLWRSQYLKNTGEMSREESAEQRQSSDGFFEVLLRFGLADRVLQVANHLDQNESPSQNRRLQLLNVISSQKINTQLRSLFVELSKVFANEPELIMQMALHAESVGDIPTAILMYEQLLIQQPDQPGMTRHLASLYLNQNMIDQAYAAYRLLASTATPLVDDGLMLLTVAGYSNSSKTQLEAAELAYEKWPDDQAILVKVARVFLAENKPQRSYAVYRQLVVLTDGQPDMVLVLLEIAAHTGQRDIMLEAMAIAIAEQPENRIIVKKCSEMYLWIEEIPLALELWIKRAKWSKGDPEILERMLEIAGFSGHPDLQRQAYLLARKYYPDDPRYLPASISFFMTEADIENAIASYEAYLRKNTLDERGMRHLAELYERNEQPLLAYNIYKELYKRDSSNPYVASHLRYLADWASHGPDAVVFFEQQALNAPGDFDRNLNAGQVFMTYGDEEKGFYFLEKALALQPDNSILLKLLSRHYFNGGRFVKSIAILESLKAREGLNEDLRILLARGYLERNQGRPALRLLSHYEQMAVLPRREGVLLAKANIVSGRKDRAIKIYRRLFRENSDNNDFVAQLGRFMWYLGEYDRALKFFEAVLKNDSRHLEALKNSGLLYARQKQYRKAIKRLKAYNRISPNDYAIHFRLGEIYSAADKKFLAHKEYRISEQLIKQVLAISTNRLPEGEVR